MIHFDNVSLGAGSLQETDDFHPRPVLRSLIYGIFPDRFASCRAEGLEPLPPPGVPNYQWHAGGDLDGIVQRLDHVAALGADCLYLNPIHPAPSSHKYDFTSFREVDPGFGGMAAFERLATACGQRGYGLILDGVFNHVGHQHSWAKEALAQPDGFRGKWFRKDAQGQPCSWRGHGNLPELDTDHPEVLAELIDGPNSVVAHWLARGATGWRLDCANDLGPSLCRRITQHVSMLRWTHGLGVDGVIGETMTFGAGWTTGGKLDGVMNYWTRQILLDLLSGSLPPRQASFLLADMAQRFPLSALLRSWSLLSSHDVPRLATLIPDWEARRLAVLLQFTLPGTPYVYYGEEIDMLGGTDPANRNPMPWSAIKTATDHPMYAWIRSLVALRQRIPALAHGYYRPIQTDTASSLLAFLRVVPQRPDQFAIVITNPTPNTTAPETLYPAHETVMDHLGLADAFEPDSQVSVRSVAGTLRAPALSPFSFVVWVPRAKEIPGYNYFKPSWDRESW